MYIPTNIVVILWTFAMFGVIFFALRIIAGIRWKGEENAGKFSIIISAKNREDTIEDFIRSFILKASLDGKEEAILNILLVDKGSCDDTLIVMKKLARKYPMVEVVSHNDLSPGLEAVRDRL